MKKRKSIALFTAAAMVLGLLGGCSGKTTGNTDTSGAAPAGEQTAAAEQTTGTTQSADTADTEIPTITIYNNSGMAASANGEGATDPKIYKEIQDYILEHTGVRVEIISGLGADATKLSTLIAGNQIDAW